MSSYSLSHLSDAVLLHDLTALVARDRATTAELLAHLAEVDARKLYLPAAYPSMYAYCVGELRLCEQAAYKRIRAARTARQFPAIFAAVADGRLHVSAVVMLTPYLTPENADELLGAAANQNVSQLEQLLAERFPRPDVPTQIRALSPSPTLGVGQLSSRTVGAVAPVAEQLSSRTVGALAPVTEQLSPGTVEPSAPRPKVKPLSSQTFAVQFTMSQSAHDKLRHAQSLLGHQVPSGDIAAVFERALDALIPQLEKRKFAATSKPRPGQGGGTAGRRYVPAHVKRAVWERDGGQCTFVSEGGRRCPARKLLEFDHVEEVARGGQATAGGIRLRCRAHNQYTAECTFGAGFMRHKRDEARRTTEARRRQASNLRRFDTPQSADATRRRAAADGGDHADPARPWAGAPHNRVVSLNSAPLNAATW